MEYENFRNLAQGIQAIGFVLAVGIGGIWTVFKLIQSKELDKSRAEALKLRKEIERKKGLEGEIKITQGKKIANGRIPVFIEVKIENKSSETHTLDWNVLPLKIAGVKIQQINDKCDYILKQMTKIPSIDINPHGHEYYYTESTSLSILPESKRIMNFFWECPSEGIYFVTISSPLPESITDYLHQSDNQKISLLKDKYEKTLENYSHTFNFNISTFFQVLDNEIKTII